MTLLLDTPKTLDQGHDSPTKQYTHVAIMEFHVETGAQRLHLMLQYGNVVNDEWISDEPFHRILAQDIAEEKVSGLNPDTQEFEETILVAADPVFTNLRASFIVGPPHVGLTVYDVLGYYLYNWLISQGIYAGTIV